MRQFVEQRGVIRFGRFKAIPRWHSDHIRRWAIKRLRMLLDSRRIWHLICDRFALCNRIHWLAVVAVECFQTVALLDVENVVVAKQNGSLVLKFSCLAVLSRILVEFPKRNQSAFLALPNVSA
jgi:hypothetical protein